MKKLIFSFLVFTICFLASCSSDEMPIDNNIVDGGDKMVVSLSSEEQIGKSNCTVSKYINQKVQPDLKTLNLIADVLNVDVKDLLVSNINT